MSESFDKALEAWTEETRQWLSAEGFSGCLGFVQLLAFVEGASVLGPEQRNHLEHCQRCSALERVLVSEIVREGINRQLEPECDKDLL